ncbi:HNH endonuclease, partial [Tepidanaerobacter acetatoxydans]|uniref:HNH endonuclease n=1 Tax=Tepidanaerobacter acetatoxydans TaxID=499229 RepID=UPI0026ECEF66
GVLLYNGVKEREWEGMRKCYICKESLDKSNSSIEHIIPNALGGNLKSRNLICKNCNSRIGSEEDAILAEQ